MVATDIVPDLRMVTLTLATCFAKCVAIQAPGSASPSSSLGDRRPGFPSTTVRKASRRHAAHAWLRGVFSTPP
jgi:hypothetical protein